MPMYHYEAKDGTGKTVVGSMDARDETALRARLVQNGYQPLLVEIAGRGLPPAASTVSGTAQPSGSNLPAGANRSEFRKRRGAAVVPHHVLTQFYRQMASMLGAGVSLPNAMEQMLPYARNRHLKAALEDIAATVAKGHPMSQAMERHPRVFMPGHIGVIRSGEGGGFTVRALTELANQTEIDAGIQTSVKFNPLLFLVRFVGAPFAVAWIVFMGGIAQWSANVSLLGMFLLRGAIAFVATILVQVLVLPFAVYLIRLSPLGSLLPKLQSAVPGLNAIQSRRDRVKILSSLSSALSAGVPISLAWELSAEAADSENVRRSVAEQLPSVTQGMPIPEAMARTGIFSDRILQLAHTGELSGNLPEMLQQATVFERDEAKQIGNLLPWLLAASAYLILLLVLAYFVIQAAGNVYGGILDNTAGP